MTTVYYGEALAAYGFGEGHPFGPDRLDAFWNIACLSGLDRKVHIIAGITPLKSLKMADRMRFHVPGVDIPENVANRMKNSGDPKREGYEIALELINDIKKIKGVHGLHITALFWEDIIPSLVQESGFLPRP